MRRMAFAVAMTLVFSASTVRAETLPLVEGVPATYTPGQDFSFILRVPLLPNLTDYGIDLTFRTNLIDPALLVTSTVAAPGSTQGYVFPTNSGFGSNFSNPPGADNVVLTISDSVTSPVTARPGINDTLAVITVHPEPDFHGPITLSLVGNFTFDDSEIPPYDSVQPFVIEEESGPPASVPAPAGVVLLGIGGLTLAMRSRLVRN
jgi:hypothetical protein